MWVWAYPRVTIKILGGFIEQHDRVVRQMQTSQSRQHCFTTGQCLDSTIQAEMLKPSFTKHCPATSLDVPRVADRIKQGWICCAILDGPKCFKLAPDAQQISNSVGFLKREFLGQVAHRSCCGDPASCGLHDTDV